MQKDWGDLTNLLHSTATQQDAYHPLEALRVFPFPGHLDPMLAGTIPLDMAIPGSALDMVCSVERGHHGSIQ
jgi:hypothetical protein